MKKLIIVLLVLFGATALTACIGALDPMGKRPDSFVGQQ